MNAGQIIVIVLSLVLAFWLAGGIWYNRRRGQQVWRWLEPGLDVFGGRVGTLWIGSSGSGLRVAVDNALAPFRRLEFIVRFQSRENLPLWLFELAQGRRDQLTFRAWLRSPVRGEVEVVPVNSTLDHALQAQTDHPWQRTNVSHNWVIAQRGSVREEQIDRLREFIATYDRQLQRLSQRRSEPHLFVQMALDELMSESSSQLLSWFKEAAIG